MEVSRTFAAGMIAGAAVGAGDGARVAVAQGLDARAALACIALSAGLVTLVGAAAGAVVGLLVWLAGWGRRRQVSGAAAAVGWLVAGAGTAGAAAAAVLATSFRQNRFLAAGVVALASVAAAVVAALLAPALARLLGGRRSSIQPAGPGLTPVGLLWGAPLVALALVLGPFVAVWRARPVGGQTRAMVLLLTIAAAMVMPWALARAARLGRSLRWRHGVLGLLPIAALALALVGARWTTDFQFVRWRDVAALVALVALAVALVPRARRWPRGRLRIFLIAPAVAVALVLGAGTSEPARKAATARGGLTGPMLAGARVALDFDGDGHTQLLGGGDCDEGDPEIGPAAPDWPDDGIDQDCDGKDASTAVLRAPPLHPVPSSVPRDLNILFVTIDTLRADHLGCYGYPRPTSAELDRLAAEGILFENGWAHAPSTRYSMPALATARWPSAIAWEDCVGCESWWPRIAPGQRTIGEAFKSLGYTTGALFAYSYFNPGEARGFERGIDVYDARRAALHVNVKGPMESVGSSAREIADDAIAFIEANNDRRFFLWVHFYDPHLGYQKHHEAPAFGETETDLYDGEIWFTDQQMGRLLAHVRQGGLWDRTAVFVTGDHGEGLGERGIQAHGYHLYAPQTKVPFVARVPGLAPRRVAAPVGHVDIAPTLVNLVRGRPEPSFLGRSLVDLMVGAPAAPQPPVFQEVTYECATGMDCTRRRGLVTESHHLIWNWMPDNTTECYDLRADPAELRDLWGTRQQGPCPGLKDELRGLVAALAWPPGHSEKLAAAVTAPGAPAPSPAHPLEARFGRAVKFLGYDLSPARVPRGGATEIVYYFESVERLPRGWKPFFHLEGPGGFRNLDHVPVDGAHPAERWRPGQRIRDSQRLTFPAASPPGVYSVYVGFFRGSERLGVTPTEASDGQDRLRVATVQVE